ncbi:hypothetical protein ABPG72_012174 [Tetrahymena utriculariae]
MASVNSKFRMIIKHFLLNYSLEQIKCSIMSFNMINNEFQEHIQKKFKLIDLVDTISRDQIQYINQNQFFIQQQILLIGLQNNGHLINKENEVIPYILQKGIRNCFQDVFQFSYPFPSKYYTYAKSQIPLFSKVDSFTDNVNFLIETIYETIQIRKKYKGSFYYQKNQQILVNLYKKNKQIEKLRKQVAQIEPLNFKNERCAYQFLNKNVLSLILSFLDIRQILNLKLSSKKMSQLIDLATKGHVENLHFKKQELMNKLNMDEQEFEKNTIFLNYYLLTQKISSCNSNKLFSFEDTQIVVDYFKDLDFIYENTDFQLNKILIQNQLNLQEKVYAEFIESFYSNQNHISNVKFIAHYKQSSTLIQEYLIQIRDILKDKISLNLFDRMIEFIKIFQIQQKILFYKSLLKKTEFIPRLYKINWIVFFS